MARPLLTAPGARVHVRVAELNDRFAVVAARASDGRLVVVACSEEQVGGAICTTAELLAAAVWLAVGRALRPVEGMRRQAKTITSHDLHRRLTVPPGRDKIPRLATTLNELLNRLEAFRHRQQQFGSDASHELRPPLAAVRNMIEVARRHSYRVDVAVLAGGCAHSGAGGWRTW